MKHKHFEKLIILLLTGIFAICVFLVLFTGVNTYERFTERGRIAYDRRICTQYLATKIHQADSMDSVYIEPFGEGNALVLKETINGTSYLTRIYAFNGSLNELLGAESAEFSPEDGTPIVKLEKLLFSYEDGMIKAVFSDESGKNAELFTALRSGEVSQ